MRLQNVLAWFDRVISSAFRLEAWGQGNDDGPRQWTYFVTSRPVIKIVNMRGEVLEATGYWSVRHYYDEKGRLLKRIPVRKDLGCGKRLVK